MAAPAMVRQPRTTAMPNVLRARAIVKFIETAPSLQGEMPTFEVSTHNATQALLFYIRNPRCGAQNFEKPRFTSICMRLAYALFSTRSSKAKGPRVLRRGLPELPLREK